MPRSSQTANRRLRSARRLRSVAVLSVTLALGVPASAAAAQSGSDGAQVLPPVGNSYNRLSVAWWQYALEQPTASNPFTDQTGARCGVDQSGPVFFLVGTLGGDQTATRNECTVPAGKELFFPLVNAFQAHVPGDGLNTPALIWQDLEVTQGFRIDELHASVDGVPVGNLNPATSPYRGCAGPAPGCAHSFTITLPASNLFGVAAGAYAPTVADGFYLRLAPLSPGVHTITFGGAGYYSGPFTTETTYRLRIVPRDSARLRKVSYF